MALLGARGDKRVLAVDWDTHALRVVLARVKRGQVRVVKAVSAPWPAGLDQQDPQAVGAYLGRVLEQQRIRGGRAIVDIPRDQAVVHTLALPAAPPGELPAMVHFQIVKELPFSLDEAVVDFVAPAAAEAEGDHDVLVAAVRNEVLAFYQSALEAAGLTLERIGFRPQANLVSATACGEGAPGEQMLFVDVGPTLTEIDVMCDGRLAFSRAASVNVPVRQAAASDAEPGSAALAEAEQEDAVASLLVEVTRSIEAYRMATPTASIGRAVIGGSCGIEPVLLAAIRKRYGWPVSLFAPPRDVELPRGQESGLTAFSAALGLVVGQTVDRLHDFDFLHPKEPDEAIGVRRQKVRRIAAVAAIWAAVVVALGYQWLNPRSGQITALRAAVREYETWDKGFKEFEAHLAQAEAWANRERVWLDEFDHVVEALPSPDDAYLETLTMDEKQVVLDLRVTDPGIRDILTDKLAEYRIGEGDDAEPRYTIDRGGLSAGSDARFKYRGRVILSLAGAARAAKPTTSRR